MLAQLAAARLDADDDKEESSSEQRRRSPFLLFYSAFSSLANCLRSSFQSPQDDFQRDVRELAQPVLAHRERIHATIKLEQMNHVSIIFSLFLLYFAATLSFALAICVAATVAQAKNNVSLVNAVLIIEGFCRTLGMAIVLFLTLVFPFRIWQSRNPLQVQQGLLIGFLLIVMLEPGMSVYSPVVFWRQYNLAQKYWPQLQQSAGDSFGVNLTQSESVLIVFFGHGEQSLTVSNMTKVFTIIFLGMEALYLGTTLHRFASNVRLHRLVLFGGIGYMTVFIPLVLVYDFQPSQVPLVGVISVLKACTSSRLPSVCVPGNGEGFNRAMVISAQFVWELGFILYLNGPLTNSVRSRLASVSYERARSQNLGFRFFDSNRRMMLGFLLLSSVIVVSSTGIAAENINVDIDTQGNLQSARVDALLQVGISFYTMGFGSFYLLLAAFLFAFAYAYLPPDSRNGITGFFCAKPHAEAEKDEEQDSSGQPIYITETSQVASFLVDDDNDKPLLVRQVTGNFFCLETEVLMLNSAVLAYEDSPETVRATLSRTPQMTLLTHLFVPETEIQCLVISDRQCLVVAFRGTSSKRNVWQDLDYLKIAPKVPEVVEVEPLLDNLQDPFQLAASKEPPLVHRGFYNAYFSIHQQVMQAVKAAAASSDEGLVLFVCGHSLGGALATHFALEFGALHRAQVAAIQLSTFGCPRVGNYSYCARVKRVVNRVYRFWIGGDPVPKLPPAQYFSQVTYYGFHHVGIEVLLDVDKANVLIAPLFIEKLIEHGWGGYVPQHHKTTSYALALVFWAARVHPATTFVPDWWLPVVNSALKHARERLALVRKEHPEYTSSIVEQLIDKEGAMVWAPDGRVFQNQAVDTSVSCDMVTRCPTCGHLWLLMPGPEQDDDDDEERMLKRT